MERGRQSGFTLLELMVAIALITIGLFAMITVIPAMMNVTRMSRESQIATSAVRSKLDEMRAYTFPDAANYSAPNMFNVYNNVTFTATGLDASLGRITFLSEQAASQFFNAGLDLDNDGVTGTATVVEAKYIAFPTRIELLWTDNTNAQRSVNMTTIIYNNNR